MLKDEFEEVGGIKIVADLKSLDFIKRLVQKKSKCPLKVALNLLVRVTIRIGDCFCNPIKNRVFDKVMGRIRIFLFHKKLKRRA